MSVFNASIKTATQGSGADSTTSPVSIHATGLANSHTGSFLNLQSYSPQLTGGGGVLQMLLLSGAYSIKVDSDQDIVVDGDLRTETGKTFDRSVGSDISAAGYAPDSSKNPASNVEVDGTTINLFKGEVTEIHRIDQTNTQINSLTYTLNGLNITQSSPHVTTVHGTNTRIVAGTVSEDIILRNEWTYVHGSSTGEQYSGLHCKGVTGVSADIFALMRSEFVEILQLNLTLGWGLIVHIVLKVLQIAGGASAAFQIQNNALKHKMEAIETTIHGLRVRFHSWSGRGGGILLGIWRILF